jgi:hypothetical protein
MYKSMILGLISALRTCMTGDFNNAKQILNDLEAILNSSNTTEEDNLKAKLDLLLWLNKHPEVKARLFFDIEVTIKREYDKEYQIAETGRDEEIILNRYIDLLCEVCGYTKEEAIFKLNPYG